MLCGAQWQLDFWHLLFFAIRCHLPRTYNVLRIWDMNGIPCQHDDKLIRINRLSATASCKWMDIWHIWVLLIEYNIHCSFVTKMIMYEIGRFRDGFSRKVFSSFWALVVIINIHFLFAEQQQCGRQSLVVQTESVDCRVEFKARTRPSTTAGSVSIPIMSKFPVLSKYDYSRKCFLSSALLNSTQIYSFPY